jgi:hypothetical protein
MMEPTKVNAASSADTREAAAPEDEITSAMIDAGVVALEAQLLEGYSRTCCLRSEIDRMSNVVCNVQSCGKEIAYHDFEVYNLNCDRANAL